jgi:high frequency lysogenization protein
MQKSLRNQAVAISGLMQCCRLVRELAREGRVEEEKFACALHPVFMLDAATVDEVYGAAECRRAALSTLRSQLGAGDGARDLEATRYAATLLHLERKLMRQSDLRDRLREGLEAACRQRDHFSATHDNVVARLADLYGETLSTLKPNVMVRGESRFLENPGTANRVRALLLAGVRSTVLWRQCGGTRLKLILGRSRLLQAANEADSG